MISVNDFKTGLTIEVDGGIWRVVDFQHVKPGKGAAFVRSKLKNLRTGAVQEKTFRAGEKVAKAQIDNKKMHAAEHDMVGVRALGGVRGQLEAHASNCGLKARRDCSVAASVAGVTNTAACSRHRRSRM